MRNLSKVLALVLSLAFVLTMFAGAIDPTIPDYLDKNELSYPGDEAVAVLSALGAVEGFPDGEFKPAENVTRAQFAKMLSIADAGADVKAQYPADYIGNFTDTNGHWALPYLNYAYLNEIMVGYGDNTIRPENNVTGFEAVKMTLVALGYDPKVEGLEGPAWQSNTAKLANRIGLLKNLESVNLYGEFDREATAILVRNAIYTETVTYVGSYANGTGLTLGEEVFDLIDVRGIVVANEYGAIGLNWEDVLTDATSYNRNAYIQYTAPNAGETRFAYRDYTGAATVGGYYVPRVITAKIASDNADLGKAYRILATGAKNPTNTNEVRKVYGVLGEIASDASYSVKTSGISAKIIDAMLTAAQLISVVDEDSVQGNIFIDGVPASYKDAKKLIGDQAKSNYPYYYVDNDADGIVDFVYLYSYAAAKVLKVDGAKVQLAGLGWKSPKSGVEGLAEGDFIAYWGDEQIFDLKKLDTFTGKVTDYSLNSGNSQLTYAGGSYKIDGKGRTFGWLSSTFTDDERVYFQQLLGLGSAAVNDATLKFVLEGDYIVAVFVDAAETHWDNYAIVIATNMDRYLGMYEVTLLTEDNEYKAFYVASYNGRQVYNQLTSWSVVEPRLVNNLVRYIDMGNQQIALYTANFDNESYAYANTTKMYFDQQTGMWEGDDYNEKGIQYGTLYDWKNGVVFVTYGRPLSSVPYSSGLATAKNENGDVIYSGADTTYGVANTGGAFQWRAYWYGEFQPNTAAEAAKPANKISFWNVPAGKSVEGDEVVYATALNGIRTLKAAAISFDYYGKSAYALPGLPIREGQAIWGLVMDATSIGAITEDGVTKYVYQVKILNPWSGGTRFVKVVENFKIATFVKGNLYKMWTDDDELIRRWESYGKVNGQVYGSDGLEIGMYVITAVYPTADGYILQGKKLQASGTVMVPVIDEATGLQKTDSTGAPMWKENGTVAVEDIRLFVTKDTDMYFVNKMFSNKISQVDFITAYGTLDKLSQANEKGFVGYFDINPTTNEIFSGWIDTDLSADYIWKHVDGNYKLNAVIRVVYDTNTDTVYYYLPTNSGVYFKNEKDECEFETIDGIEYTYIKVKGVQPYELLAPVGDEVGVTLPLKYDGKGAWYVKYPYDAKTDTWSYNWGYKWIKYGATTILDDDDNPIQVAAAGVKYDSAAMTLEVERAGFSMNSNTGVPYKYTLQNINAKSTDTQGYYVREGNYYDTYAIYGDQAALAAGKYFTTDTATGVGYFEGANYPWDMYGYNPDFEGSDDHAYNYEVFYVMYNNAGIDTDISGVEEEVADAVAIVYVDLDDLTSIHNNGMIAFPFV